MAVHENSPENLSITIMANFHLMMIIMHCWFIQLFNSNILIYIYQIAVANARRIYKSASGAGSQGKGGVLFDVLDVWILEREKNQICCLC